MTGELWIRTAAPDDAAAFAAIYAPIVNQTHISFEEHAPGEQEMRERIVATLKWTPWLAAVVDDEIAGYAYAGRHRERAGYRWSVDVSVYLDSRARGRGIGRVLYEALFKILEQQGFRNAYAGVTLPNDASIDCIAPLASNRSGFIDASVGRPARGTMSLGSAATCAQAAMTCRRLANRFRFRGLRHRRFKASLSLDRVVAEPVEYRVLGRGRAHVTRVDFGVEVREEVAQSRLVQQRAFVGLGDARCR